MALSKYGKVFDAQSPNWSKDKEYNSLFLTERESYFNSLLKAKGYAFLKDVYEALGVNFELSSRGEMANPDIELDFNVDGYILDRIPEEP